MEYEIYKDENGKELKEGDKITTEVILILSGDAEIKKNENGELCVYMDGLYRPLSDTINDPHISLYK